MNENERLIAVIANALLVLNVRENRAELSDFQFPQEGSDAVDTKRVGFRCRASILRQTKI
jgi:hypothetical protein